jgi:hypothetical protein
MLWSYILMALVNFFFIYVHEVQESAHILGQNIQIKSQNLTQSITVQLETEESMDVERRVEVLEWTHHRRGGP